MPSDPKEFERRSGAEGEGTPLAGSAGEHGEPHDEPPGEQSGGPAAAHDDELDDGVDVGQGEPMPLARVRYGLAKEMRLYRQTIVVELKEEHEETIYHLDSIKRIILTPGEYNPAKLVLMFDLDDDTTIIVAEGMTNVRDFRVLLAKLREVHPEIELEPADMDTQLQQALEIRRRSLLGCYGGFAGICVALWIIYLVVAWVGHVH